MATFRSFSEIVSSMIRRLSLSQPNLDTKPGTVSRDLFIDPVADEVAKLYSALNVISEKQSLTTAVGSDLEKLAANFGISRGTGSAAGGTVLFVTNSLVADISIPNGTIVTSRSGINFRTIGNYVMSVADKNRLASNATRFRRALNIAGLNSIYALEVPIQAERPGSRGNVSSLQITRTGLQANASVINLVATTGGSNSERDSSFKARILSVFSGANIGTDFGYRNALLGLEGVLDALVVGPGNSLMLRDGTETIALEDGTSRILSSGTGGKVDIYVLGRKIEPVTESYIFNDYSGSGDISDERNDYLLGQGNQDITRTSEERRVLAFRNGTLPAQPIDSIISVTGSQSGPLTEAFFDANGIKQGHFELIKDFNPETGGSPFGFDKIHFISGSKEVSGESITKGPSYTLDTTEFSGISEVSQVYQDVNEVGENSDILVSSPGFIRLKHSPVIRVSRVQNKTTGEIYSVINQNLETGELNETGIIQIQGKSLPNSSSTLSVNYTWRRFFDKDVDFSGRRLAQFFDADAEDAIDWSQSGGIFEEEGLLERSEDGINYEIQVAYDIAKTISVYTKEAEEESVSLLTLPDGSFGAGIVLDQALPAVKNIISIRRKSDGLELYNTTKNDGSFSSREIYLPSDSLANLDDLVIVNYNKVELFDISNGDGSFYSNRIVLPSEGVLDAEGLLDGVDSALLAGDPVFIKYTFASETIYPSTLLSSLPIIGSDDNESLFNLSSDGSDLSNQPIFYNRESGLLKKDIVRFGPTPIRVGLSGITSPGKIKINGTSLNIYELSVTAGPDIIGRRINLEKAIASTLGSEFITENTGIARVFEVALLDSNGVPSEYFDLYGHSLNNIEYAVGYSKEDLTLGRYEVLVSSNPTNQIALSSASLVSVKFMLYNKAEVEELYFDLSSTRTTRNRYGRISRISLSSGFRNNIGAISGNISLMAANQPTSSTEYFIDYNFESPKEGERITVSYNINKLILDATNEIERVRPINADVLVKEAEEILVDVSGTILINEDLLANTESILEEVSNVIANTLSSSELGGTIDYSDIISIVAAQNGVDSVNISLFNESGNTGRRPFIQALDNQYISPGTISFEAVSRNKFRIN